MPTPIRFYTDENVSKAVVKGLRSRGIDVQTCQEAGLLSASDEVQLQYAAQKGRTIFTHDADFLRLHAQGVLHAGIVYAAKQETIGSNIRFLKLLCEILTAEEMAGQVEFI